MNDNWLKYLVALSAILIAGSAAYFSVTGLGVLFSGAAIAVMVMASSLEFAKLVTATYLKQKWNEIGGLNKWYLTSAVAILMLITSAGIFGYLSNAFQQQNLALQQVDRQILVHSTKIEQNESQIKQLSTQISESNTNQGKILDNGKVNSRLLRSVDNRDKQIAKLNDRIAELQKQNASENDSINKIKTDNISIEKEVGGFRFVAEAFGVELNSVVKFFIILIVIVFDPLAVALIISFNQLVLSGRKKDEEEQTTVFQDELKDFVEGYDPITYAVDEDVKSDKEDLKQFVDESSRLHLSEDDLKKLEEVLLNPPPPNDALKKATEEYFEIIQQPTKERQEELLSEIIKNDQELGLYDEDWGGLTNEELIGDDEIIVNETPVTKEETQFIFKERNFTPITETSLDDDMQRLKEMDEKLKMYEEEYIDEDGGIFSTIEPTEEEESRNFSTIEPISENIFHYPDEFVPESNEDEPILTFEEGQLPDDMLQILDDVQSETFSQEPTQIENTSSENEDEKKNY